jgi:hypothetical protein
MGALTLAVVAVTGGFVLTDPRGLRALLAAAAAVAAAGLGFLAPRRLVYALVVWLTALGLVRRLVSTWSPAGTADLLLLVGPAAILVLFLVAVREGAFRNRTTFASSILVLSLLVLVGAVNPLQGNLVGGVAGLLFVLVPTLGFWIGRAFVDDRTLTHVLILVAGFSVAEALYGYFQSFVGFPSWDSTWIATHQQQYSALWVGNAIRPFGSFSSAAEYAVFLAFGLIVWAAIGISRRRLAGLAAAAALFIAIFYASGRGTVVLLVAALGLAVAARLRLPFGFAAATAATFVVLVPLVAGQFAPTTYAPGTEPTLVSHQVSGLANPLDPQQSTLRGHIALVKDGLVAAFHHPVGNGIASITIAGAKFGGVDQTTEADPSNMGVALGFPGLLVFAYVLVAGFLEAYRFAATRRDALALIALAITTVMALQWFNGGQYSVALIFWLVLGWVDCNSTTGQLEANVRAASVARNGRAP